MTWIVGLNVPGYLPDTEPSEYATWQDAKSALLHELESDAYGYADAIGSDPETDETLRSEIADVESAIARALELKPEESFGETVVRFHYFMERLEP